MTTQCPRVARGEPAGDVCLDCFATAAEMLADGCPYDGLSDKLTQSHLAIKSDTPAACDPTDGVCEACQ